MLPVFGCCLENSPVTGYPGHPGGAALLFGFFLCIAGPGPLRTGGCWMVRQTTVAWRPPSCAESLVCPSVLLLLSCVLSCSAGDQPCGLLRARRALLS